MGKLKLYIQNNHIWMKMIRMNLKKTYINKNFTKKYQNHHNNHNKDKYNFNFLLINQVIVNNSSSNNQQIILNLNLVICPKIPILINKG